MEALTKDAAEKLARSVLNQYIELLPRDKYDKLVSDVGQLLIRQETKESENACH